LTLQLRKFFIDGWTPKKMGELLPSLKRSIKSNTPADVFIDVPDQIDLSAMRATGKLPNEELMPEGGSAPEAPAFDQSVVDGLMGMGFSKNQAEHAAVAVKGNNLEAATEWLIARLDDPSK
jgi:uncharacterized UBP type Zn finger protein